MTSNAQTIYLGTMSGTSMDGLDLVAVNFNQKHPGLLHKLNTQYPPSLRKALQSAALRSEATINEMCSLDTQLGQFYASTINHFIAINNIDRRQIAAIGSHGQTLRHNIQKNTPYTLQIGDPNIIAAKTGVTVVADFRRRDLANGGQGAPLAPAFHQQVFQSKETSRAIVNIGGIANITHLPADTSIPVSGFDTGPGNTLLDSLSFKFLNKNFDHDGDFARSGKVQHHTLQSMLDNEPYFQLRPPKSTGTDYFSPDWLNKYEINKLTPPDAMATLVELTAISIANGIKSLKTNIKECFVCGGGAHNSYLLERLSAQLQTVKINSTLQLGIHPDWVEAMAFAWLARQTTLLLPGNLPSVTSAKTPTILGGVYFSQNKR